MGLNYFSLLVYAAEVSERLSSTLVFFSGIVIVLGTICVFLVHDRTIVSEESCNAYMRIYRRLMGFAIAAAIVIPFIPSPRTIYIIAASEISENIINLPETNEMLKDVRIIIQKQLKSLSDSD